MPAASSRLPSPSSACSPISPSTRPAITATFFLAACARRTTSPEALPTSDVRSNDPSPVITSCAFASAASNPTRDSTHPAPGSSCALAKNASPAPSPPAAPPPGSVARSPRPWRVISSPRRSRPRDKSCPPSGPAPFCGPNTGPAPSGPTSAVVTSANATTRASSPQPPSITANWTSEPPPSGRAAPSASRRDQPNPPAAPPPPPGAARPAVHSGSTAQSHHHRPGTALDRLPNHLTHAARRGPQRVELIRFEQRDAAGGGALEQRSLGVDPAELARHRVAQGARDLEVLTQRPGWQHRVEQPITPIGNGALQHGGARHRPARTHGDRFRDLPWPERALEGRWGN